MSLNKQAKILTKSQISSITSYLLGRRNGLRNVVMFQLSVRSGLRAKEISSMKWSYVLTSNGDIGDVINLPNIASKGNSGRAIPLSKELKKNLESLLSIQSNKRNFNPHDDHIIISEQRVPMKPNVVVHFFRKLYHSLGLVGCSSHSGRRTFITNAARMISTVGGSLEDVRLLAGHSSLNITSRYIDPNADAVKKLVNLI